MTARLVAAAVLVALAGGRADAQELATELRQLRVLVKPGDLLTVIDVSGRRVQGRLTQLDDVRMVLEIGDKQTRQFDGAMVNSVEKHGGDSLKNGALIGLVSGSIFGIIGGIAYASEYDTNYAGWAITEGLVYGGIGAAIGTGIDALIQGRRVIYAKSQTTVSVAPLIGRDRRGVLFTLRR